MGVQPPLTSAFDHVAGFEDADACIGSSWNLYSLSVQEKHGNFPEKWVFTAGVLAAKA